MNGQEQCRICGSDNITSAFSFDNHSVVHHLLDDKSKTAITANFDLYECNNCGFLFSKDYFLDSSYIYENYITLSSAKVDKHATTIIERISQFGVKRHDNILEIGCNDGKFIQQLKGANYQNIHGIEPAKDAYDKACLVHKEIQNDFFSSKTAKAYYGEIKFQLVITRQVLEHIRDLHDFIEGINNVIDEQGILIIEIPDHTMNYETYDYSFWEEHINYFTFNTVRQLLEMHGYYIFDRETVTFSGKALLLYCQRQNNKNLNSYQNPFQDLDHAMRKNYIESFHPFKQKMHHYLDLMRKDNDRIVIYGAGCRSLCLLSFLELDGYINFIVDDSSIKINKFEPNFLIPIYSSENIGRDDFILLGVNSEIESTILNKRIKTNKAISILPPSLRLPEFWVNEFIQKS